MSFLPLEGNLSESLLGIGTTRPILRSPRYINRSLSSRLNPEEVEGTHGESINKLILTVIISAIIFVTFVALYDVLKNYINNHYARIALEDPRAENSEHDIIKTEIANQESLISSMVFAGVCIVIAVISLYFIIKYIKEHP